MVDQAVVPGGRRRLRVRSLHVFRCADVRPSRYEHMGGARVCASLGHPVHRIGDGAQQGLDDRYRVFARRGFQLDRLSRLGRLSPDRGGRGVLRPLLRRELGQDLSGRPHLCGAAAPGVALLVRHLALEAQGIHQQELLLLPLRLSARVAALHQLAVDAHLRREHSAALYPSAGEPGREPVRRPLAGRRGRRVQAVRALEPACHRCRGASRQFPAAFSAFHGLGRRPGRIP